MEMRYYHRRNRCRVTFGRRELKIISSALQSERTSVHGRFCAHISVEVNARANTTIVQMRNKSIRLIRGCLDT